MVGVIRRTGPAETVSDTGILNGLFAAAVEANTTFALCVPADNPAGSTRTETPVGVVPDPGATAIQFPVELVAEAVKFKGTVELLLVIVIVWGVGSVPPI